MVERVFVIVFLILSSSCGAETSKIVDDFGVHDMGMDARSDGMDGGSVGIDTEATPLLERQNSRTKVCSNKVEFRTVKSDGNPVADAYLTSLGGGLILAWAGKKDILIQDVQLNFADLSTDGIMTNLTEVAQIQNWYRPRLSIHVVEGETVAIAQREQKKLHSLLYENKVKTGEHLVVDSDAEIRSIQTEVGHDKLLVLWKKSGAKNFLTVIDKNGERVGNPVEVFSKDVELTKMITTEKGFKVAGIETTENRRKFKIVVRNFDKSGQSIDDEKTVYTSTDYFSSSYYSSASLELVSTENGFLLSWSEEEGVGEADIDGYYAQLKSTIKLLRLNRLDQPQKKIVKLKESLTDVDLSAPTLTPFGDYLALIWSTGKYIYFCAGCFPDHQLSMVLIDPLTLNPVSQVLEINSATEQGSHSGRLGGLFTRHVEMQNERINIIAETQYHVHTENAFGSIDCQ